MKVKDFITLLQTLPQDDELLFEGHYDEILGDQYHGDMPSISYQNVYVSKSKTGDLSYQSDISNYRTGDVKQMLVLSYTNDEPYLYLVKHTEDEV